MQPRMCSFREKQEILRSRIRFDLELRGNSCVSRRPFLSKRCRLPETTTCSPLGARLHPAGAWSRKWRGFRRCTRGRSGGRCIARRSRTSHGRDDFLAAAPALGGRRASARTGSFSADAPAVAADIPSSDGLTQKFLLRLADGQTIETVLMGYPRALHRLREHAGGLRDGLRLLRHGADGFRAASAARRDRRRRCCTPSARCARAGEPGCAISCSWAWASRCTITTR